MDHQQTATTDTLYLGGGCFWCTHAVFERVQGVLQVESGYANGHVQHPTYEQVCEGDTGHAEVVRVVYDPQQIALRALLEIFFATHDPTTPNRQGNDIGPQYRSAIYTTTPEQQHVAQALVREMAHEGQLGAPIVTEIAPLTAYWPAEAYHQDYFRKHPTQGYCAFVVGPKVHKFLKTFARHATPG